jgi:hypothetical protein
MLLFMPPYCRCHSDMYDDIRLHYGPAVTSQLFWLAPLSDEILGVVTSKKEIKCGLKFRIFSRFCPFVFVSQLKGMIYLTLGMLCTKCRIKCLGLKGEEATGDWGNPRNGKSKIRMPYQLLLLPLNQVDRIKLNIRIRKKK